MEKKAVTTSVNENNTMTVPQETTIYRIVEKVPKEMFSTGQKVNSKHLFSAEIGFKIP